MPNVNFIIGCDEPKKIILCILMDALGLKDRAKLYWFLAHSKVREVIMKEQIYLNSSLIVEFILIK